MKIIHTVDIELSFTMKIEATTRAEAYNKLDELLSQSFLETPQGKLKHFHFNSDFLSVETH